MRGRVLYEQGQEQQALDQARAALASMEWQLPLAKQLAELQPTAAREASLAFLLYNRSQYRELLIPTLTGARRRRRRAWRVTAQSVAAAARLLERALERGGSIGHSGREEMQREDADAGARELAQRARLTTFQLSQGSSHDEITSRTPRADGCSRRAPGSRRDGDCRASACTRPGLAPSIRCSRTSTVEVAKMLRNGQSASVELVSKCYERIDAVNPLINAVVATCRERALCRSRRSRRDARRRQAERARCTACRSR